MTQNDADKEKCQKSRCLKHTLKMAGKGSSERLKIANINSRRKNFFFKSHLVISMWVVVWAGQRMFETKKLEF